MRDTSNGAAIVGSFVVGMFVGAMLTLGATGGAAAQEKTPQPGTGMICDTADQVVAVADLFNSGKSQAEAIEIVNSKVPGATGEGTLACTVASVVYVEESRVAKHTVKGKDYDVVKIVVIGLQSPMGMSPIPPAVQYTSKPAEGPSEKGA